MAQRALDAYAFRKFDAFSKETVERPIIASSKACPLAFDCTRVPNLKTSPFHDMAQRALDANTFRNFDSPFHHMAQKVFDAITFSNVRLFPKKKNPTIDTAS